MADAVGVRFVKLRRQTGERMTGDTTVRRTPRGYRQTLVSNVSAVTERNIKLLVKELPRAVALRIRVINGAIRALLGCCPGNV